MSTRFERAFQHTVRFEGGFVDDPDDPGGATNYGVSLRYLLSTGEIEAFDYDADGDVDADDIRKMTPQDAQIVYRERFWFDWMDDFRVEDLAIKVFDLGVNTGPAQAGKFLQRAINEQLPSGHKLIVDGIIGPKTCQIIKSLKVDQALIALWDVEHHAARFYYMLAEKRRASRKYLFGWLRRCYDRPEFD